MIVKNCENCIHWKPREVHLTNFFGKRGTATDRGRRYAQCARFQTFSSTAIGYFCGRDLKFWQSKEEENK